MPIHVRSIDKRSKASKLRAWSARKDLKINQWDQMKQKSIAQLMINS